MYRKFWSLTSYLIFLHSYGLTEREGYTFAMSIIGMRAKDWREILNYINVGIEGYNIGDIVQHFNKTLGFTSSSLTWGADQVSVLHMEFYHLSNSRC